MVVKPPTYTAYHLKTDIPYAREANLANHGRITYASAVKQTVLRRRALAAAEPFSIVTLGLCRKSRPRLDRLGPNGGIVNFSNGYLTYVSQGSVRILNLYESGKQEIVVDMLSLLPMIRQNYPTRIHDPSPFIDILGFDGNVLCLQLNEVEARYFIIIDVRDDNVPCVEAKNCIRHIWKITDQYRPQIIVTQSLHHVFCCCKSRNGGWYLHAFKLNDAFGRVETRHCRLSKFVGEIVPFISDGWFHATSLGYNADPNVPAHDNPNLYCVRFPIRSLFAHPSCAQGMPAGTEAAKFWRRAKPPYEAPVQLDQDERSGRWVAYETATYAAGFRISSHSLVFPEPVEVAPHDSTPSFMEASTSMGDMNDWYPYGRAIKWTCGHGKWNYSHLTIASWFYDEDIDPDDDDAPRMISVKGDSSGAKRILRLRISSRDKGYNVVRKAKNSFELSEEPGVYKKTKSIPNEHLGPFWPPASAPRALLDMMNRRKNPGHGLIWTERVCLILDWGFGRDEPVIIMVNFDPSITFPGLTQVNLSHDPRKQAPESRTQALDHAAIEPDLPAPRDEYLRTERELSAIRTERPMWETLQEGFEFSYS